MYITTFNYAGSSNLIKKSQVTYFLKAAHLFDYMSRSKERFDDDLSDAFDEILTQKSEDLDKEFLSERNEFTHQLELEKKAWFDSAQQQLDSIISDKVSEVERMVSNFTDQMVEKLKHDLPDIVHDESVLALLSESLQNEVAENAEDLNVELLNKADHVELLIETEHEVVSISTEEIIQSLKKCLETVSN